LTVRIGDDAKMALLKDKLVCDKAEMPIRTKMLFTLNPEERQDPQLSRYREHSSNLTACSSSHSPWPPNWPF